MVSNRKLKTSLFIAAGCLMVLLAVGAPAKKREVPNARRQAFLEARSIVKNCVPGTQLDLPGLPNKISFLCFIDVDTGLLDNLGPVRLPNPIVTEDGQIGIKAK